MTIEAIAWKTLINETHTYNMQFVSGSVRESKDILETLKDWRQSASGTKKDGSEILVFKKVFPDTNAWLDWAKTAPFIISEEDKDGDLKRLKTTVVLVDDGKRKCKICGKSGHNSATCAKNSKNAAKVPVNKVKGKKICGFCGGVGHNKRTCVKLKASGTTHG